MNKTDLLQYYAKTEAPILFEAGHYYQSKGPTQWSHTGLALAKELAQPKDSLMLFVDDVHPIENVWPHEVSLPVINLDHSHFNHVVYESAMTNHTKEVLDILLGLSRKHRAKTHNGQYFCSGFPLTDKDGKPLCVLLDLTLTVQKLRDYGVSRIVNILPIWYEEEQSHLDRLLHKVVETPYQFDVLLYNRHGHIEKRLEFTNDASVTEQVFLRKK